ncbi:MAG: hypothetical protein P8170_21195 [Gemmatimonadota bacterium]
MTRSTIAGGAFVALIVVLALAVGRQDLEQEGAPAAAAAPGATRSTGVAHEGLLYGRVTTDDGAVYEGRLRWGGDEEALWGNYFNGFKDENPWVGRAPSEGLPTERRSLEVLGIEIAGWERQRDLRRPFMARFGDIARIDPRGRDLQVTLKSGTVFHLDRYGADDLADGVRVWDASRGVVDLGEWRIRSIELLAVPSSGTAPSSGSAPHPLYGAVRTRHGDFTGLVQWDREQCLGSDTLTGLTADGEVGVPFDAIGSIARRSGDSALVTLLDGREIVLSGTRQVGRGNRGIYVDDPRYGRVLVSWDAFERVDFGPGGAGPAYGDFPPGRPLTGSVLTRSGRRLAGRLVYDLDESETTETLDAPLHGVDYTIPFGLIVSIVLPGPEEREARRARVSLQSGEELRLELTGDLGEQNGGMLIFVDGRLRPDYVPWTDVEQVDFDRPVAQPTSAGPR